MKKQTDVAKKQYQGLDNAYEFNKKEVDETINKNDDKTLTLKSYSKSDLIYGSKYSSYRYYNIKKFGKLSFESQFHI